jgi:hypothetical protein
MTARWHKFAFVYWSGPLHNLQVRASSMEAVQPSTASPRCIYRISVLHERLWSWILLGWSWMTVSLLFKHREWPLNDKFAIGYIRKRSGGQHSSSSSHFSNKCSDLFSFFTVFVGLRYCRLRFLSPKDYSTAWLRPTSTAWCDFVLLAVLAQSSIFSNLLQIICRSSCLSVFIWKMIQISDYDVCYRVNRNDFFMPMTLETRSVILLAEIRYCTRHSRKGLPRKC